jgi:hypothetical protein
MTKIHALPPLTDTPEIADVLPFDDASVSDPSSPDKTKKMTMQQLRDFVIGQFAVGNNLLINGNFDVWQRGTTFTQNDDLYIADRWNALQEANSSWTFARDTAVPTSGAKYSLKCSNATANNQAAIVNILESNDAQQLANQNVSLSFYAKTVSAEIANLRCAILSWTGTADAVTSDVISTWAQNGTNPTWATNWTMENVPVNLALTNSFARYTVENVAIDTASMKNVAVVIWVDDGTITSGDDFWISEVMLNVGGTAATFTPRPFAEELCLAQRYYIRVRETTQGYSHFATGFCTGITFQVALPVTMRTLPTITASGIGHRFGGADYTLSAVSATVLTAQGVDCTSTSSGAPGNGNVTGIWTNAGTFYCDAEL